MAEEVQDNTPLTGLEGDDNSTPEPQHGLQDPTPGTVSGNSDHHPPSNESTISDDLLSRIVEHCTKNVEENIRKGLLTEKPNHKRRPILKSRRSNKRSRYQPHQDETSPDEREDRGSEHSSYHSDDDRSCKSSSGNSEAEEPSGDDHREVRRKRKRYSEASDKIECFPHNGETYVTFNKKIHTYFSPTSVGWGTDLIDVKWLDNKDRKAFCQIKPSTSSSTPYMDQNSAHENLTSALNLNTRLGDNFGFKRKGFTVELEPSMGLAQTMKLLKSKDADLIQAIISGADEAAISKTIPESAFSAPSIAIFSKGWSKTEDYSAWAKGDILNMDKVAQDLDMDSVIKISKEILEEERNARALFVNNLTGLVTLELFGNKLKDETNLATTHATARLFLPNIKPLIRWVVGGGKERKKLCYPPQNMRLYVLIMNMISFLHKKLV